MKFSVITVCKNEAPTIENTILSVINQTYNNFEFIIIDGKSTDKTIDIINKYKDKISIVISESDNGVYSAMNKGIKRASGDFIVFINGNDSFKDNFVLEDIAKIYKKYQSAELIIGNVDLYKNEKFQRKTYHHNIQTIYDFQKKLYTHQGIFYSKKIFQKYGTYNENLKIISDNLLNAKILLNRDFIVYTKRTVANFTLGGLSSNVEHRKQQEKERKYLNRTMFKNNFFYLNKPFLLAKYFLPNIYILYCNSFLNKDFKLNNTIIEE